MKPEIGDKVRVDDWSGQHEGVVFRLPTETVPEYYVGRETGSVIYTKEDKITVLFRPRYEYVNQNPFKVGDLVTWYGERCLVVGQVDEGEWNYRVSRLNYEGDLTSVREQDLTLVHAAGQPEEKVSVQDVEPEGWYGYPDEVPVEEPSKPFNFEEVYDEPIPF